MATRRLAKPAAKTQATEITLYPALKFIAESLANDRDFHLQHSLICNGWCVATDHLITVGSPVREEFKAAPHTGKMIAAIERCLELPSLTQPDENKIIVKSGKFKAAINCVPLDLLFGITGPDPQTAPITELFIEAIAAVKHVPTDTADKAFQAGVCLRTGGTVVGCDGSLLIEAWHGLLTPAAIVPRRAADALCKVKKKPVGIGASRESITIHYEDGSFFKTQLYNDSFPDFDKVFGNCLANPVPVPAGLYEALSKLKPFVTDDGSVFIKDGFISTALQSTEGAQYELETSFLNGEVQCYSHAYLMAIETAFKQGDFLASANRLVFFGDNCRGIVMQKRVK